MLEQVSNFEQNIEFIEGFAGSGKSTELAKRTDDKTLVLTPTHKAASVLMSKGVMNVYTIHSTLKLVPTLNESYDPRKGQRIQKLKQIGKTSLSDIDNVFIDEFSMINQRILDLLLEILPATTKVTVFGDPYQLPPIDGEPIDALIYTDKITQLTTQHRAEAPEVVETFMRFMNYIKDGSEKDLTFNKNIEHGTIKDFNPDTDRALAYTNAKVIEINNEIAEVLKLPKDYSNGENLLTNGIDCILIDKDIPAVNGFIFPTCISKGKLMEGDTLQLAMQKTQNDIDKWGTDLSEFNTCTVEINGHNYSIYYDADHYANSKKLKSDIDKYQALVYEYNNISDDISLKQWCGQNRSAKYVKERGWAWSAFIKHQNLVFNLQRPFATTIHKAQGSEFSTVYIAQDDIKKSIYRGYYMNYARLMYVALSRAINKVIII